MDRGTTERTRTCSTCGDPSVELIELVPVSGWPRVVLAGYCDRHVAAGLAAVVDALDAHARIAARTAFGGRTQYRFPDDGGD